MIYMCMFWMWCGRQKLRHFATTLDQKWSVTLLAAVFHCIFFLSGCANLLNENQSVQHQLGRFYWSYTCGTVSWPGTWSISWEFLGARLCLFPLLPFFVKQNSPSRGCSFIFCGEFIFYYFLEAKVRSKHLLCFCVQLFIKQERQ